MVRIRKGDTYIEVDDDLSDDEIDTFEKLDDSFGDTSELFLDDVIGIVKNNEGRSVSG